MARTLTAVFRTRTIVATDLDDPQVLDLAYRLLLERQVPGPEATVATTYVATDGTITGISGTVTVPLIVRL